MKYNLEWLIFGFAIFWLIELVSFLYGMVNHPQPVLEFGMPLFFWALASFFERTGVFR